MWSYFFGIIQGFLCFDLLLMNGVFVVYGDEVKSVSVMEGDSVTLHTDITDIQRDDLIMWMFGPKGTRIAEIYKKIPESTEIFTDRLKLDSQTGSLTIINITNSGLYQLLTSSSSRGTSYKKFNVTVYAPLPVPVIDRSTIQCSSSSSSSSSSSKCVLLCSVLNVRDVSLSWYKGNSLLSSISVSDLNIRLSLPLEVEYQDTNTYRCVVNNPITNQTQHLNINDIRQMYSELQRSHFILPIAGVVMLLAVIALGVRCCKTYKQTAKAQKKEKEIIYTKPMVLQRFENMAVVKADRTVYSRVIT
ncbi:uncharacterized protein [Misgurnus anguillicaudatus]|uniref:uncharacterized protein isoform X2 n=1 Tax=Misgurnus anguillicaudatus TaxID=75329 RepID=UPI003CCFB4D7